MSLADDPWAGGCAQPLPHWLPPGAVGCQWPVPVAPGDQAPPGPALLRARQHQAGRCAAAHALQRLGLPAHLAQAPLPRLPGGAAGWPAPCVGSITHTAWASHAAVGWAGQARALGIDSQAHLDAATAQELHGLVADPPEHLLLAALGAPALAMTLLFSAKEAFYKALGSPDPRAREFNTVRLLGLRQTEPPTTGHQSGPPAPPPRCWAVQLQPAAWVGQPACQAWVVDDGQVVHSTVALGGWG